MKKTFILSTSRDRRRARERIQTMGCGLCTLRDRSSVRVSPALFLGYSTKNRRRILVYQRCGALVDQLLPHSPPLTSRKVYTIIAIVRRSHSQESEAMKTLLKLVMILVLLGGASSPLSARNKPKKKTVLACVKVHPIWCGTRPPAR